MSDDQKERNRSIAIVACLDAKQAFELYSYRIIDHEGFIIKMIEIGGVLAQIQQEVVANE